MENFNSGDHVFIVYDIIPKASNKGTSLTIIIDVPFTEELFQELGHFMWKDVKILIAETEGKRQIESEFYLVDVKPKDFVQGPRIRIIIRQPFESKMYEKIGKMLWKDIKVEMEIIQKELGLETEEE